MEELLEALLLAPAKDPPFNPEDRLFNPYEVLQLLPGLVSITTKVMGRFESRTIRLAHFSVKEYLVGSNIGKGPTATFGTSPEEAHQFITESCLVYILEHGESKDRNDSRRDFGTFPLIDYACRFWHVHRKAFVGEDETPTGPQAHSDTLIIQLLLSLDKLRSWMGVYQPGKLCFMFAPLRVQPQSLAYI